MCHPAGFGAILTSILVVSLQGAQGGSSDSESEEDDDFSYADTGPELAQLLGEARTRGLLLTGERVLFDGERGLIQGRGPDPGEGPDPGKGGQNPRRRGPGERGEFC